MAHFGLPNPSIWYKDKGIKFILSPKSHDPQAWRLFPIVKCTVKVPRSFNFWENLFWIIELHSSVSFTVSYFVGLLFLATIYFTYLEYFGISCKISTKGRLLWTCLRRKRNIPKHSSSFNFFCLCANGGGNFYLGMGASTLELFTSSSTLFLGTDLSVSLLWI